MDTTKALKLKWKVSDTPTGRYRSFENRHVVVYDYGDGTQYRKMRKLTQTFRTLSEAKKAAVSFLERHPEMHPKVGVTK